MEEGGEAEIDGRSGRGCPTRQSHRLQPRVTLVRRVCRRRPCPDQTTRKSTKDIRRRVAHAPCRQFPSQPSGRPGSRTAPPWGGHEGGPVVAAVGVPVSVRRVTLRAACPPKALPTANLMPAAATLTDRAFPTGRRRAGEDTFWRNRDIMATWPSSRHYCVRELCPPTPSCAQAQSHRTTPRQGKVTFGRCSLFLAQHIKGVLPPSPYSEAFREPHLDRVTCRSSGPIAARRRQGLRSTRPTI